MKTTGINIPDSESLCLDQSSFERRILDESREIAEGVVYTQGTIELGEGAFTNFYDLSSEVGHSRVVSRIKTSAENLSIKRVLANNEHCIGAMNAGFFHLVDEGAYSPIDPTYNLCIRDSAVVGLPVSNRPILYTAGGAFESRDTQARGTIRIGDNEFLWRGARSGSFHGGRASNIVLYNSACCIIKHVHSDSTGNKRVLDDDLNFTPSNEIAFDIVVGINDSGELCIKDIVHGGNTNLFSGNFILQVTGDNISNFCIGDVVEPLTLDGLAIGELDSAITVGPSVHHFTEHVDHEINHDFSLGDVPPFSPRRMARSIVYKDTMGNLHLRVFDGAPKTQYFQGITPHEASMLLPKDSIEWAYHLDPGQSSRLALRTNDGEVETRGNSHYVRWPKKDGHPFLWSPSNGRRVPSAIVFEAIQD